MIQWPDEDIALSRIRSFANIAAQAMASSTGMRMEVRDSQEGVDIVTDDPEAVNREFGTEDRMPESWSIRGLIEAERAFNEHAQGSL